MGASGPSAGLHRLYITEPGERPAPRFSYQLACEREVAGADCAERARITTKLPALRNPGRRQGGNRLTFAPLCAKGRGARGGRSWRQPGSPTRKRSAGRHALSAIGRYSLLVLGLIGLSAPASRDRKSTRLNSSHEWISYAVF